VNTPDYLSGAWLIIPAESLSSVSAIQVKYRKIVSEEVVEMTPEEKAQADVDEQTAVDALPKSSVEFRYDPKMSTSQTAPQDIINDSEVLRSGRYLVLTSVKLSSRKKSSHKVNLFINGEEVAEDDHRVDTREFSPWFDNQYVEIPADGEVTVRLSFHRSGGKGSVKAKKASVILTRVQ
jgi:hypothetical protein